MNAARWVVIGTLLLAASLALAGDAKLVEDKVLDIGGAAEGPSPRPAVIAAQLSPDGKYLLYAKAEMAEDKGDGRTIGDPGPTTRRSNRQYRLFLRDLATGKDTAIPAPAWSWDDPLKMMLSLNVFSADGKKIVLGIGATATEDGVFDFRKGTMKPALYDIASGKLDTLPIEAKIVLPLFHRNGKDLLLIVAPNLKDPPKELTVAKADKYEPSKVAVGGVAFDMCPTADVVPVVEFPERGEAGKRSSYKLRLFDLSAGKVVAELPVGERNTKLDDCPPRWTPDGRFLYYVDVADDKPTGEGPARRKQITRIWDRKEGKEAGIVDKAIPVGPGRKDGEMVLLSDETKPRLVVHDAATGMTTDLLSPEGRITPLFAGGGRIVYAKAVGEGKVEYHLAKIE